MREAQDVDVLSRSAAAALPRSLVLALGVGALVVLLDQVTKAWATSRLVAGPCTPGGDGCIDLVGSLRLHLVHNSGAAFSTGASLGPLFGVIAAVMTVFLLHLARQRTDRLGPVLLGAVAGGAIGNLIDRIVRAEDGLLTGSVVDFIDLQWWPVFNVADSAVVVGVISFAILVLREGDADEQAADEQAADEQAADEQAADEEAADEEAADEQAADEEADATADGSGTADGADDERVGSERGAGSGD